MNNEELLMQLFEHGIDTSITLDKGSYIVELINTKDNRIIGVAKSDKLETALASIIRRLVDDSKMLKETINCNQELSIL